MTRSGKVSASPGCTHYCLAGEEAGDVSAGGRTGSPGAPTAQTPARRSLASGNLILAKKRESFTMREHLSTWGAQPAPLPLAYRVGRLFPPTSDKDKTPQ